MTKRRVVRVRKPGAVRAVRVVSIPGVIPPVADPPVADPPVADPVVVNVPAFVVAFGDMFPGVTIPAWVTSMVPVIVGAFGAIDPAARATATFADWLGALNASDTSDAPANGHRFTGGSGADIARTQNAIYVACAVSGIAYRDIPYAFGAAMWRHVLGVTRCNYAAHMDYFGSTLSAYCGHHHNDTPGVDNTVAENAVRVWRDTKPAAVPVMDVDGDGDVYDDDVDGDDDA
jgi:hypothetical protein